MNLGPILSLCAAIVVAFGVAGVLGSLTCLGQHSGRLQTAALAMFVGEMVHEIRDLDRPLHGARIDQTPLFRLQLQRERETVGR